MAYNAGMQAGQTGGTNATPGGARVPCRYPDCDGLIAPGAPYCDECGRSQAPAHVAVARAAAQARPAGGGPVPAPPPAPPPPPLLPARTPIVPTYAVPVLLVLAIVFVACLVALALTLSATPPATTPTPAAGRAGYEVAGALSAASGSRMRTVVPAPGLLSSVTCPLCAATISRTIASPSPL